MNIRRLQGWALLLSAICLLVGRFLPTLPIANGAVILAILGTILLIFSIPAIQALQPEGLVGWIGIVLIELAALIALAFQLDLVSASGLALISAILGMLGRVVTGWLTIRDNKFPAWAGWAFLVAGVLNLVGGFVGLGIVAEVVFIIGILLEALALLGYGARLTRQEP